jgi:hypothetical protein
MQESCESMFFITGRSSKKDYKDSFLGAKINPQYFKVRSIYTKITFDPVINDQDMVE